MAKVFTNIGHLFRSLVTDSGYRRAFMRAGLDKDLDDLANESRPGSLCDILQGLEQAWIERITDDCGPEWGRLALLAWTETRQSIQQLALHVDFSASVEQPDQIASLIQIPMIANASLRLAKHFPGPEWHIWWKSPFAAWLNYAAETSGLEPDEVAGGLANFLDVDDRSISRWTAGEAAGALAAPYRPAVVHAVAGGARPVQNRDIDRLCGLLMVAVAFQAQPAGLRDAVQKELQLRRLVPWSLGEACERMTRLAAIAGNRPIRRNAIPLLQRIETAFSTRPVDGPAIKSMLAEFTALILAEVPIWRASYQYIHDWFSARLEALGGNDEIALTLYGKAVDGVWWFGGENQHPILNEALLHAVGIGKKVAAEKYWDKACLLGLNRWPKRQLDDQEIRRLSFAYEHMFAPAKAKSRIPPVVEVVMRTEPSTLTKDQLEHPNRKVKHADGRSRRTALMEAIRDGGLDDVKRLLGAGGDPNDYIPESGEGPLTYAMRRACDRKDPAIMQHMLGLDLLPETVNRPASTKRETPLKLAIEMADAAAVRRLIALGADVEAPCEGKMPALCYAMASLYQSVHRGDTELERAYFSGQIPGDVYDAKEGAVLDVDLAKRRIKTLALRNVSDQNKSMFAAVVDYMIRAPEAYTAVVRVLLECGADPNRRYKVEPSREDEWTPTLFAAQLGSVEVFKLLVAHGGDPAQTLYPRSALAIHDALWVAVAYHRQPIVELLSH